MLYDHHTIYYTRVPLLLQETELSALLCLEPSIFFSKKERHHKNELENKGKENCKISLILQSELMLFIVRLKLLVLSMASKRELAIVLFIFTCNVLCTELSLAAHTITRVQQLGSRGMVITCMMDKENSFVKKQCYINQTEIKPTVTMVESLNITDCHGRCWETCSCIAYASMHENGTGCILYEGTMDIVEGFFLNYGIIYIRNMNMIDAQPPIAAPGDGGTPATSVIKNSKSSTAKIQWVVWLVGAVPLAMAMGLLAVLCYFRTRKATISRGIHNLKEEELGKGKLIFNLGAQTRPSCIKLEKCKKLGGEMQIFSLRSIWIATNQFSSANKLGEGGFGSVYKGILPDGQEVAVKRLSRSSSQGVAEFKNEMKLIAQLQHTNLVRLLGCCIGGGEKMLVYEFLPHKSLDSFLFDPSKKKLLDWEKRLNIIEGTAQGILYLHKYSRQRVIHRDLKTSNILLDNELNPKISDFGLARIVDLNKSETKTTRVVGTYGYMSPEYAMEGFYSEKSDVFSFGVIILEIMSGMKTTSLSGTDRSLNLIGHAWDLWREGRAWELVDQTIAETCSREELLRYIHVGLLCVEESISERPKMSGVVSMLTNSTMLLPAPKQPAFYNWRSKEDVILHEHEPKNCSLNYVSISPIRGR